ncbi:aldehyde dehydrogenase family protein [Gemmobacter fulvus]|uniref:aldehyde dehydrogenase family protein n=1 Tax=Gemmobacter fulvus TaxID=2840474 RepID=UPI00279642DD|nr:aldehyde dehydrogenase family protein [Gemmobacter fulvus]MDQ1850616.1 aldehyde dehydrogenase family protein [Gemmobacter fulvus]
MIFKSINPTNEQTVAEYPAMTDAEVETTISSAQRAFLAWRNRSFDERAKVLRQVADAIDDAEQELAGFITREMGKPISQSIAEVRKSAGLCRHYAEHSASYLASQTIDLPDGQAMVVPEPLGVVYSITPWNFPIWQLVRLAIPTIAAGNAVVVKPAPNVIGSAEKLIELFKRSDAPEGLYQCLRIDHGQSDRVIADDRIVALGLTGSERAGSAVGASAGHHLKKVVLELGGSDPFIVLADADVQRAAKVAAVARFQNAGQVCIAAKRILVAESVSSEFMDAFLAEVDAMKIGDPTLADVFIGPMARGDLRDEIERQMSTAITAGARVVRRGGTMHGPGFFYDPSVIVGGDNTPFMNDEIFGPAVVVVPLATEEALIRVANETRFGLSASLWTSDQERAANLARQIEAGCVFVNTMSRSDAAFPLGGIKRSGFGRELGREGAREYTNLKTIVMSSTV